MDLTSKDYYQLNSSLIPDNIYQQIVGTIKEINYSNPTTIEGTEVYTWAYLKRKDLSYILAQDFPLMNIRNSSLEEGKYNEVVTYTNDGAYYKTKTRTEKVSQWLTLAFEDDVPIKFKNDASDISFSDITGTTYTRSGYIHELEYWGSNFDGNDNKLYALQGYNEDPSEGGYSTSEISNLEIEKVEIDSIYDGSVINTYTGKYRLVLYVHVFTYNASMYYHERFVATNSWKEINITLPTSFKVNVTYYRSSSEEVEFEYHAQVPNYVNYPLKVTGNDLTTKDTTCDDMTWDEYISNQLLTKYVNGKFWVSAKVKASFIIDNSLSINSIINIKKLDNTYISRYGTTTSFQLKNIEFNYSGSQFIANIILLEV